MNHRVPGGLPERGIEEQEGDDKAFGDLGRDNASATRYSRLIRMNKRFPQLAGV
jgi:hypothetical protein